MIEPLLVSSLMSHDTFLRDWIIDGEFPSAIEGSRLEVPGSCTSSPSLGSGVIMVDGAVLGEIGS